MICRRFRRELVVGEVTEKSEGREREKDGILSELLFIAVRERERAVTCEKGEGPSPASFFFKNS